MIKAEKSLIPRTFKNIKENYPWDTTPIKERGCPWTFSQGF